LTIDDELVLDLGVPRDPDRGLKVCRCPVEAQRLGPLHDVSIYVCGAWKKDDGRCQRSQ